MRALTVNRGLGEGIATQTPVIVPDGLVGRVVRVRPGASVVQLLNDPASTVGAMVQRTRTPGLVEGDPAAPFASSSWRVTAPASWSATSW